MDPLTVWMRLMKLIVPHAFLMVHTARLLCSNAKTMFVSRHIGNVMAMMTVAMVQMKNFTCAWMFPVIHQTVSGVTTIAAFIVMRCAMVWMTVEMELMRQRSTVENRPLNLVQNMNISVAMGIAFHMTMCVMMPMTVVTGPMNWVAIKEKKEHVLKIYASKIVPN
uniref:Alternative protein LRP2 n=1 Tax=Homo sapiens TaxID=9606 RepID=L8E983_HUMAN|nr:alternative protein LRP2 [Homo sapiens]